MQILHYEKLSVALLPLTVRINKTRIFQHS